MTPRRPLAIAPLFLVIACSASAKPPPLTSRIEIGPSFQPPPPPVEDGRFATVKLVPRPKTFALDGDLAEWGEIRVEQPMTWQPPPKLSAPPGAHLPALPVPPEPSVRVLAASGVAVAFGPDGATIAARLTGDARGGLWLGLRFDDPTLPPLGIITADGELQSMSCDLRPDGTALDGPELTACQARQEQRGVEQELYSRRFARSYWVGPQGIRALADDDSLVDVPGAQIVYMESARGITLEATLPARALPRTVQGSVTSAGAVVSVVPAAPPVRFTPGEIPRFDFTEPVGFEPHAKLRAGVLDAAPARPYVGSTVSYQPGDDLEVEEVDYVGTDAMKLQTRKSSLYARDSMFGDVEIGYSNVGATSVVTFRNGEYVDVGPLSGALQGSAKVGEEMHFFSLVQTKEGAEAGEQVVRWECVAVMTSGAIRFDLVGGTEETFRWTEATAFAAKDFSSFGITGTMPDRPDVGSTATWTYDPAQHVYALKLTDGLYTPALKGKAGPKAPKGAAKDKAPGKDKAPAKDKGGSAKDKEQGTLGAPAKVKDPPKNAGMKRP